MITIRTRQDVVYSSIADLPDQKIKLDTFEYCKSFRSVKFANQLGDIIEIPFENIALIVHSEYMSRDEE